MKVRLKGVGALPEAELSVDGLTVITGVNNTGKSTIMKSIFVLADAAADLENEIQRNIIHLASRIFFEYVDRLGKKGTLSLKEFASAIVQRDLERVEFFLKNIAPEAAEENGKTDKYFRMRALEQYADDSKYIRDFSSGNLDSSVFFKRFVKDNIYAEFSNQIRNIRTNEPAQIEFVFGDRSHGISFDENDEVILHGGIPEYYRRAVYIDTPYVLDDVCNDDLYIGAENHAGKIARMIGEKNNGSVIERISADERAKRINALVKKVLSGTFKPAPRGTLYILDGAELSVKNLATGMKTFSLIKMLIESGQITEGSIILMDEPEAHVHPEWQLILAEILVLLSKDMGIKIVISTHSPQMLLAIEAYSMEHDMHVDYYNTQNENGNIAVEDVSGMLERVYGPMADAYDKADEIYLKNFGKK